MEHGLVRCLPLFGLLRCAQEHGVHISFVRVLPCTRVGPGKVFKDAKSKYTSRVGNMYKQHLRRLAQQDADRYPSGIVFDGNELTSPSANATNKDGDDFFSDWDTPTSSAKPSPALSSSNAVKDASPSIQPSGLKSSSPAASKFSSSPAMGAGSATGSPLAVPASVTKSGSAAAAAAAAVKAIEGSGFDDDDWGDDLDTTTSSTDGHLNIT
ncbi:ADP-ribosylation factor GTPase activating protein, ER-Golgi transport [Phlyctochytrium bullatum]|nr:ADP-ribosylation factor GTPase activating protein, ER-Golgi transport [Phlyctochytrium bullatum]